MSVFKDRFYLRAGLIDKNWHKPGLSGLRKVIFAASCKNFPMMRKFFCSLRIFFIFVKTHILIQHLISKVFQKFIWLASKIFAWWEIISACCKDLHPWFCSLEKPHYSLPLLLSHVPNWQKSLVFIMKASYLVNQIKDILF